MTRERLVAVIADAAVVVEGRVNVLAAELNRSS